MSSQGRSDPTDFLGHATRDDVAAIAPIFPVLAPNHLPVTASSSTPGGEAE